MSNYFAAFSASFHPVLARRTGATRIQETDTTRLGSENCRHRAATRSAVSWLVTFEIVPASVSECGCTAALALASRRGRDPTRCPYATSAFGIRKLPPAPGALP